jgi:FAD/FMN-containing dehydrogenase/Fe-S oxidoreductase
MSHSGINLDDIATQIREGISGEVRTDPVTKMLYRTDASMYEMEPLGLILPAAPEDVVHTVRVAASHGIPLLPRGGGTSLAGQSVGRAFHVDYSKYMNTILELDAQAGWVRVQPGVVLDELNENLKPHGLQFAPDVSTSSRANIGGMIGNNSCGAHSILYGKTIDHVIDLTVVLADGALAKFEPLDDAQWQQKAELPGLEGEIYRGVTGIIDEHTDEIRRRFPSVMRRVSGYNLDEFVANGEGDSGRDLCKLVVGSEGSLCHVVEARLNLVPLPHHKAVVACHFHSIHDALQANLEILHTSPASIELVDKILLDLTKDSIEHRSVRSFLQGDPEALLFVEYYADSEQELEHKVLALEELLDRSGLSYAVVQAFEPVLIQQMWDLRKAGLGLLMSMPGDSKPQPGVEDSCVPVEVQAEYAGRVQALMEENDTVAEFYGHASVGVLHIRPILNIKTAEGVRLLRHLQERMSDMVLEYGGAMSAEHGDGLARGEWIAKMFGQQLVGAFAQIKALFDPGNIMNPGKIVQPPRMDENLRYDEAYTSATAGSAGDSFFRYQREGSLLQAVEMCSGVGHCRKKMAGTMCPSYMATLEEEHSTRGRANALRAALSGRLPGGGGMDSPELARVMDLCLECKACKSECPSSVDMARLKYEFLAHYREAHGYPLRSRLFGHIGQLNGWLSRASLLANGMMRNLPSRWLLDCILGIDRRRKSPRLASQTFSSWFRGRSHIRGGRRGPVLLFNDTFTEYNDPQIGMAATMILESAGFEVVILDDNICCCRPTISEGFLRESKNRIISNLDVLEPYAREGIPMVGLEPSCVLTFRDDYVDLVDDPRAIAVKDNTLLLDEFLTGLRRDGELELDFTSTPRNILIHGHCHQKALVGTGSCVEVMNMPPGFRAQEIDAGCCGMAGSFGYEKEHYDLSMRIGEDRLFPAVRSAPADTEIAATGTSCRHQIADATGRAPRHWAEILVEAL